MDRDTAYNLSGATTRNARTGQTNRNAIEVIEEYAKSKGLTVDYNKYINTTINDSAGATNRFDNIYLSGSRLQGEPGRMDAFLKSNTPPPAPAPTPRPTYSAPSAPPAPTVASASSVNEVRESDKKRKGFQSTLLSKGQNPSRSRSRSKQQESKMRQGKPSYGETTKKTLLGSAS